MEGYRNNNNNNNNNNKTYDARLSTFVFKNTTKWDWK